MANTDDAYLASYDRYDRLTPYSPSVVVVVAARHTFWLCAPCQKQGGLISCSNCD